MLVNQGFQYPGHLLSTGLTVGSIPPDSERFTPQRYSRVSLGSVVSLGSSEFRWGVRSFVGKWLLTTLESAV